MAQLDQQMPIPMPDLSTLRITAAVSMLGKAYGCGQCSGKIFNKLPIFLIILKSLTECPEKRE